MASMSFQSNVHILSTLANNISETVSELNGFVADADVADYAPEQFRDGGKTATDARVKAIHRAASLQASADALALYAKTVRDQLKEMVEIK